MKKLVSVLVLVGMLCCLLAACAPKITAEKAWQLVQEDLGDFAAQAEEPHIHSGIYDNQECYNIFVTVAGESLQYVVSITGKILHKGLGNHSH